MNIDKRKVLLYTGIANIIVFIIILINIVIVFPPTPENLWIYGIYIILAGLVVYVLGMFLVEGFKMELIGTIVVIIGEMLIISFFALMEPYWASWVSIYIIYPTATFFIMMIIAFYYSREDLENRRALNLSLMLFSGSLFFLMVEAAIREPELFQSAQVPIWAIIIIIGGLMLYGFTTWKIFEKPSYIMALTGAFIVNIGVIMLEIFYRIHEITGIITLLFLPPAAVFFILIFVNYKVSPVD
ncbi:MAG: hypothetical protein ACFFDK_00900 [Promethearchaeota archaeon]